MVTRYEMLERLAGQIGDALVVTNLKGTAHEWHHLHPEDSNLLYLGMGMPTATALGLAMALPHRQVVALDGDGSVLLDLAPLVSVGQIRPANLTVVIFDNEAYESNGALPTATAGDGTDLTGVGLACAIEQAVTVSTADAFDAAVRTAFATAGPHLITAKVTKGTRKVPITMTYGKYNKYVFVKHIERTEGIKILQSITATGQGYTPNKRYFSE